MAMGLPAVVFDNPVNREILEDLGVYATYGDMHSLTRTLISILQDEKRAKKLGEESYRKAVSDYSWRSVGCKLLQLYQQFDRKDSRDSAEEE
jgi:glycosyltransferase involved in cell wall biosynthesis